MVKLTQLDEELIRSICHEYRMSNCNIVFNCDASVEDLVDTIIGNR